MKKVLWHPDYGYAQGRTRGWISRTRGTAYVGGYWGAWRIYANLPLSECKLASPPETREFAKHMTWTNRFGAGRR